MKFFKSVIQTMKDTTWPTAKENRRDTTRVVVVSILFVIFFALLDWGLQSLLNHLV